MTLFMQYSVDPRPARMQPRMTAWGIMETLPDSGTMAQASAVEFARCFLRLANLPNFALDRLSRYETNLWRQAARILYALKTLDRRKPQERTRRYWLANKPEVDRE
jgi:hypothetical protein